MTNPRDDMVFRPRLAPPGGTNAPRVAHALRAMGRARGRLSILGRIARRAAIGALRSAAFRSMPGAVGPVARLLPRGGHPAVYIGAAAVVALLAAVRLESGRTFENMGQQVADLVLGDLPDQAAADAATREFFTSDGLLMAGAGRFGITGQMRQLGDAVRKVKRMEALGRRLIEHDPAFQTNAFLDMLVLRLRDVIKGAWQNSKGPQTVDDLAGSFAALIMAAQGYYHGNLELRNWGRGLIGTL